MTLPNIPPNDPVFGYCHTPFRTPKSRGPVRAVMRRGKRVELQSPLARIGLMFRPFFMSRLRWRRRGSWLARRKRAVTDFLTRRSITRAVQRAQAYAKAHPTCDPHEHDWNNEGVNPDQCLRCGMSFTRYIFMECE